MRGATGFSDAADRDTSAGGVAIPDRGTNAGLDTLDGSGGSGGGTTTGHGS